MGIYLAFSDPLELYLVFPGGSVVCKVSPSWCSSRRRTGTSDGEVTSAMDGISLHELEWPMSYEELATACRALFHRSSR